jgi:ribosomal protein S18 acetylase RimI-like enzyme
MSLTIRRATKADAPALSRICLLTANAGKSAENLHDYGELPGFVFSVPYVELPTTWAFVLVDESDGAVGYIVGSTDTRAYEKYATEKWWPVLAEKYPPSLAAKPEDKRYMDMFQNMATVPDANIAFAAPHLHINILENYQRKGWGRKLIRTAIEYLKGQNVEGAGVCLGLDPRNSEAKKFYKRMGFVEIGGANDQMGVKFENYAGGL